MKEWHFFEKVYRRWVVVMICDVDTFRKELETNGYKYMDEIVNGKGMCVELNTDNNAANQNCTIIWMPEWETATLVHEITHLVMMCFDQVLVPISRENTEAFAFYSEYWFNEINRVRRRMPEGRTATQARAVL